MRKALEVRKAGHAGTLDPLATGVLLVCLGEATKISSHLMGLPKLYEATMILGESRDTGDVEGQVIETASVPELTEAAILSAFASLTGEIMQTPPMYSALKRDGVPLYRLARKGIIVERQPRPLTIYEMKLLSFEAAEIRFQVRCSKGTYVRTLVEDVGRALGSLAYMSDLRRLSVGGFTVERSVGVDGLDDPQAVARGMVPVGEALMHLNDVVLSVDDYEKARHGGGVAVSAYGENAQQSIVKMRSPEGILFALGKVLEERIKVERILHLGAEA